MTQDTNSPNPAVAPQPPDPLSALHKMSRTAGAGTQEYVAINPLAVTALVLGVASGIVVFGRLFFVVPLVAIAFGILALYQIRNSNGTQSGRLIAALGLALAIGLMGYQLALEAASFAEGREDRQQLEALVQTLSGHIVDREYDQAYSLFSDRFRQRVTRERFDGLWDLIRDHEVVGALQSMQATGLFAFETDAATQTRYAAGMSIVRFSKTEDRQQFRFRRDPQRGWQIDDIPSFFPPEGSPMGG
jgi:stress-induced morphogen